jgi:hypothetical protein
MRSLTTVLALACLAGHAAAQGTDSCTSPTPISGLSTFNFNNGAATNTTGSGTTCGGLGRDLFWTWTAPSTGTFEVSTCGGASFDTVVAIYAGATCPTTSQAFLACNDDSCALQSSATFNATSGAQYLIRVGSYNGGAGGAGTFTIAVGTPGGGGGCPTQTTGPDVIVGNIPDISNYAPVSGVDAISLGTDSCNIGDTTLAWVASTNQHPVIGGNMYRYSVVNGAGRFEQIGMSWLKHGFTALAQNLCCPCNNPGTGSLLGVGCSDPYGSGLNGSQSGLGPRWQVNAHTGFFNYPPANPTWSGSVARRLQFLTSDVTGQPAGTRYFGEAQYVTPDDSAAGNQNNNSSYREMATSDGANFTLLGSTVRSQAAIEAWPVVEPGAQVVNAQVPGEGLYKVGWKVTNLGNGTWHYEYAVYNMNSHRSAGSFTVPVGGATITSVGFHDVDYRNGDGEASVSRDGSDWTSTVSGGNATWATTPEATNANANALRWGSTYNFRFVANTAPTTGSASIGLWRSGSPGSITVAIEVPSGPVSSAAYCFGDGSGTACPCGNNSAVGANVGCLSSLASGGRLLATGVPSISNDTLVLGGSQMPNSSALYFQGTAQQGAGAGSVFGDGLRCAAGTVIRLGTKTNAGGGSSYPAAGDTSVSVRGAATVGASRGYQVWYRNAAAFCSPSTFNLTNGWWLTWQP